MRPFAMLGALFASMFGDKASPVDKYRREQPEARDQPAPKKSDVGYGTLVFPPMRWNRARANESQVKSETGKHYREEPHPVVLPLVQRMSRLAKRADEVAAGKGERLRGKALKRRARELQCAVSSIAYKMAESDKRHERRAA